MMISIGRNGARLGEWTKEQIFSLYKNEDLLPTDFYWMGGMSNWKTLETFFLDEVITAGCQQILKRPPTAEDFETWEKRLLAGATVMDMIVAFANSDEFNHNVIKPVDAETGINILYQTLLGRDADTDGLGRWAAVLQQHGLQYVVASAFSSPEYAAKFGKYVVPHAEGAPSISYGPGGVVHLPNAAAPQLDRGRLIAVSCHCQTGGIAAALQAYLPHDTVLPLTRYEASSPEREGRFAAELANVDIWVTNIASAQKPNFTEKPGFRQIKAPGIVFPAFHPDYCHTLRVSDQQYTVPRYNSAIGAWAYNKGLELSDAAKLFNRKSYAGLGYFDLWNPSVSELRKTFEACEFDFARFMLAVKREGCFMYTINHPKVNVIVEVAKQVALKLGASDSSIKKALDLDDGLNALVWPIYPEIADEYALPNGSYDWKMHNTWLEGIEAYLEKSFQDFAKQNIPRNGLVLFHRDAALYDRILGPQVGVNG